MSDPIEIRSKLDESAIELDRLSREASQVERTLGGYRTDQGDVKGIQTLYDELRDKFEVDLWTAHIEHDKKLPSAEMRVRLFHHQMPKDLLERYTALIAERGRLAKRISVLKAIVDSQRSLLSAEKAIIESGG